MLTLIQLTDRNGTVHGTIRRTDADSRRWHVTIYWLPRTDPATLDRFDTLNAARKHAKSIRPDLRQVSAETVPAESAPSAAPTDTIPSESPTVPYVATVPAALAIPGEIVYGFASGVPSRVVAIVENRPGRSPLCQLAPVRDDSADGPEPVAVIATPTVNRRRIIPGQWIGTKSGRFYPTATGARDSARSWVSANPGRWSIETMQAGNGFMWRVKALTDPGPILPTEPAAVPAGWDAIEPTGPDRPDRCVAAPVATQRPRVNLTRGDILALANRHCEAMGFPAQCLDALPYVKLDPAYHRRIARAFDAVPDRRTDPTVQAAYRQLAGEIDAQYWALRRAGLRFEPFGDDVPNPYPAGSADVFSDIAWNGHLFVYNGGENHAVWSRETNWRFRAVHDVFGHFLNSYQFGPRGEENAWRCHRLMFTPTACLALTTETRGQNSWVNFGPFSDRPVKDRPYADQKACILPTFTRELY